MTNAVDIENVSLVFGGEGNNPVLAVDTINIAIPKGQFVAIVGPSGCGKTTLLTLIGALRTCQSGELTCLLYTSPSPRDRTRSRMPSSA